MVIHENKKHEFIFYDKCFVQTGFSQLKPARSLTYLLFPKRQLCCCQCVEKGENYLKLCYRLSSVFFIKDTFSVISDQSVLLR